MKKLKLLTLFVATLFATSVWAAISLGDGTGLEWQLNTVQLGQPEKALVITYDGEGTGIMPDYSVLSGPYNRPGWYSSAANIVSISLPAGLKNISKHAFLDLTNSNLTEFSIPASVTSIGNQAIGITYLESLICNPTTAPTLGVNSLYAHAETFSIIYPCGSGESYVSNWPAFYSNLTPENECAEPKPAFNPSGDCGTNAHYAFNGNTGVLTISGTGAMSNYTAGTQPWYSYMNQVTSIVIEDGITAIGNLAFSGCSAPVTLPSTTLTSIGTSAFSSNTVLTSISIPASVTTIGNNAFQSCSALASVTFASPNSALTSIGNYAFKGTALTSVTIPATTNGLAIGTNAFEDITTLTSLSFATPSNVTTISNNAFKGTGITSVTIPATQGNMTIGNNAFNCSSLANVEFASPSKVTTIGANAFYQATISSITLPASLISLAGRAFRNCTNLAEVIFTSADCPSLQSNTFQGCNASLVLKCPDESGLLYSNKIYTTSESYWNILYMYPSGEHAPSPAAGGFCGKDGGDDMWWDIVWNDDAKCIMLDIDGEGAMEEWDFMASNVAPWHDFNSWIKYIRIAEGVTTIGGSAFVGCDQVKTFIIPSTVTSIGADAFYGCDNDDVEVYSYANPDSLTWDDRNCDDFLTHGKGARARTYTWDERNAHLQETKCYVPSAYLAGYREKWNAGSTAWTGTDVNVFFAVGLNDANDAAGINEILRNTHGERVPVLTLTRPLNRDGYFATICLPINMDADAIAKSALKDAEIKEFTNATVTAGGLDIEFSPVTEIEAGKPYFVKYTGEATGDALDRLDFVDAVIDSVTPIEVTHDGLTMVGTYVPKSVSVQTTATDGDGVLFLAAENKLYWPSKAGNIKPFRAYFKIAAPGSVSTIRRGMPARIVEREHVATGVETVQNADVRSRKLLNDGMLIIEKNGVRYNAQGQIVK